MEVKNDKVVMLSNYEVYSLLKDIQSGRGHSKPNKNQPHLATITYETTKYLEDTPCKMHSPEVIQDLKKSLKPFNLTESEQLQILNMRPTTAVEIQLIIEESEERMTEDQIYELIDIVVQTIPEENMDGEMEVEEEKT